MSIDWIRQKLYEKKLRKQRENLDAGATYVKMRESIEGICNTQGFGTIVDYFKREVELHESRLEQINTSLLAGSKVDQVHINVVLGNLSFAKKFLTFLVRLLEDNKLSS